MAAVVIACVSVRSCSPRRSALPEVGILASQATGDRIAASGVVSLLAAGYAALAGLMVTFLVGYPLTWSTALIAGSVVCAGAMLTARVVASPDQTTGDTDIVPTQAPHGRPGFSRRRFISLAGGAIVAGTGATGVGLLFVPTESARTGGGPGGSLHSGLHVSVTDLRGASEPAPGGTRRQYLFTAHTAAVRLPSGHEIQAWTYNGRVPGPPITATAGDLVEVTLRNTDIDDGLTVHWHGYDVACGEDGAPNVTQAVVAPGEEFSYRFRADQVGTYWYHTHQASHRGVRRGLYGTLVVTPRGQAVGDGELLDLTLPVHTFDGSVVLADLDGRTEHIARAGTTVRMRLINTDSDPHRFTLAGTPFRVTAVDGRDLHQPGEVSDVALRLPAGGRYDLVYVMADSPVALVADNDDAGGFRLRSDDHAGTSVDDTSDWPELDLLRPGVRQSIVDGRFRRPPRGRMGGGVQSHESRDLDESLPQPPSRGPGNDAAAALRRRHHAFPSSLTATQCDFVEDLLTRDRAPARPEWIERGQKLESSNLR